MADLKYCWGTWVFHCSPCAPVYNFKYYIDIRTTLEFEEAVPLDLYKAVHLWNENDFAALTLPEFLDKIYSIEAGP